MRRFERLRKLARELAANNGHDLGHFRKTSVTWGQPTPTSMPGLFVKKGWHGACCLKCGAEVMVNTKIDPINHKGHNVWQAPIEGRAIHFALTMNHYAADGETKLPFPKRAKGAMYGDALSRRCQGLIKQP